MCVCVHIYSCVSTCVSMCMCMCTHIFVCLRVCMFICVCDCVCTYFTTGTHRSWCKGLLMKSAFSSPGFGVCECVCERGCIYISWT